MGKQADPRYNQIGIDRIIKLKWLDRTAHLVLAGNKTEDIKRLLVDEIQDSFQSKNMNVRGSLNKTITILMKILVRPPKELNSFYKEALKLLSELPSRDHIAIYWGLTMAVYPFMGEVAAYIGRLLRLQEKITIGQILRRIKEQYGERQTVSRACQRVVRSFVDWGVLRDLNKNGTYIQGNTYSVTEAKVIGWLVEALLYVNKNDSSELNDLLHNPRIFPFHLSHITSNQITSSSPRLDLMRHGLDNELVILKRNSIA